MALSRGPIANFFSMITQSPVPAPETMETGLGRVRSITVSLDSRIKMYAAVSLEAPWTRTVFTAMPGIKYPAHSDNTATKSPELKRTKALHFPLGFFK